MILDEHIYDLIIIGAGPSGLTAAIYAKRAGIDLLVLDKGAAGGKMLLTESIENWPGDTITQGFELAANMEKHAKELGTPMQFAEVKSIEDAKQRIKKVLTRRKTFQCKSILIATGTVSRKLGIEGEDFYAGRGVSYCAVCDGSFFKEKDIIVIGGGNTAFEEANYLTRFGKSVKIILRRDKARADKIAQDRALANPKIEVIYNKKPLEILGNDKGVTGIKLIDSINSEISELKTDAVFPFIGEDPITNFVSDLGILDEKGYIQTSKLMETQISGLFASGDVRDTVLRQIVTAASDGAIAAQTISKYLETIE